jgi:nucleoid-associated protein YgaU
MTILPRQQGVNKVVDLDLFAGGAAIVAFLGWIFLIISLFLRSKNWVCGALVIALIAGAWLFPSSKEGQEFASVPGTYTIKRGDTFSKIATNLYGDREKWRAIAQANPDVNPNQLEIGQVIKLPDRLDIENTLYSKSRNDE